MTIPKKERMLHIIDQLESYADQMSEPIQTKLQQAKKQLSELDDQEVEQLTDKVFSKPATEQHINFNSPENLLHSCYSELDRLTKEEGAPEHLQEAVQEMRYYFSIEERDGFFP
ncbi:hypothetical protein AWH56_001720 [Anaerobacillus isosaccharinicus]|uniref:Uncharacterized protein n=1 Tax=Anaerobacillus isosaccharinicus TaxID=1532552 RepID=A0A7S7RC13_9BACI|nr:hypothetical protein [Anaerobacillus isosaccharinicus]MBA5585227.1 hypothetical protein [Anaerobacillus isosaccharinicus]QOY36438.1 hypothetical protein AWH56_001720 [Anaerobacillus isosaccharinicus]